MKKRKKKKHQLIVYEEQEFNYSIYKLKVLRSLTQIN